MSQLSLCTHNPDRSSYNNFRFLCNFFPNGPSFFWSSRFTKFESNLAKSSIFNLIEIQTIQTLSTSKQSWCFLHELCVLYFNNFVLRLLAWVPAHLGRDTKNARAKGGIVLARIKTPQPETSDVQGEGDCTTVLPGIRRVVTLVREENCVRRAISLL